MVIWRSKDFPRSTVLLLIHFVYIAIEMQNSFEGFLVGSETNLSVFSVSISSPGLWGWLLKITPQNCGGNATSRVARRTNWTLPINFGDDISNGSCSFQQDRNTTPTSMFRCIFVSFRLLSTTANHWWVVTFDRNFGKWISVNNILQMKQRRRRTFLMKDSVMECGSDGNKKGSLNGNEKAQCWAIRF